MYISGNYENRSQPFTWTYINATFDVEMNVIYANVAGLYNVIIVSHSQSLHFWCAESVATIDATVVVAAAAVVVYSAKCNNWLTFEQLHQHCGKCFMRQLCRFWYLIVGYFGAGNLWTTSL